MGVLQAKEKRRGGKKRRGERGIENLVLAKKVEREAKIRTAGKRDEGGRGEREGREK